MPRPRKNDPTALLRPILAEFARTLASAVERTTLDRVRDALAGAVSGMGRAGAPRSRRAPVTCYYPGCKNLAAPRFGMFCAALHKDIPKSEKEKYRAAHGKNGATKAAGKRGRKRRGPGRPAAMA